MLKMIIADDERIVRESIIRLIDWKALGIEITASCKNGIDALEAIIDRVPDIVLTDIRMPGMDGLELMEEIQRIDPGIQMIILSGYSEFEYAQKALKYGAADYLLKPVKEEELIRSIRWVKDKIQDCDEEIDLVLHQLLDAGNDYDYLLAQKIINEYFGLMEDLEECRKKGFLLLTRTKAARQITGNELLGELGARFFEIESVETLRKVLCQGFLKLLFNTDKQKLSIAEDVKRYVIQNIDNSCLSLKYVAERCLFMNVDYVSRIFLKQTGEKFSEYLNRTRVEYAKKLLLKYGPGSIHKVAAMVGVGNNPQYFSQIFKKHAGITPSQFISGHWESPPNEKG